MFKYELSLTSKHSNSVVMPSFRYADFGPAGVVPR